MPDGSALSNALGLEWTLVLDNFPYLAFLLPIVGGASLWQRNRRAAEAWLLAAACIQFYNLSYRINDIAPYYLSLWALAAVLVAVVIDAGCRFMDRSWHRAMLTGALSCLLLIAPLVRNWKACDLSHATWVREFARHKLENTDP